jgi:hypothetical protein
MALSRIGAASNIESLAEQSAEANACNLWYNYSRKQALAATDWSFARKRQNLTVHGDAAPEGVWTYRYQYPSDCISIRKIQNPTGSASLLWAHDALSHADAVPFEVELDDSQSTQTILTDLDSAIAVYTFNLTNVTLFSEYFVSMFATGIAANIAFSITGNPEIENAMVGRFNQLASIASSSDANERVGKPPRDVDWIRGRE